MLNDDANGLTAAFYENDGTGMYSIPTDAGFENDAATSFANAIGDIDNNGYPDITVLNYAPNDIYLWKNECPQTNNFIKVKLQGVTSNRQGIGSWIEISVNGEKQYNYTLCGEGYLGQNSSYEFFGIGNATSIDYIKVTWLSGTVDIINNPNINVQGTVVEGSNTITLATNNQTITANDIGIYPNPSEGYFDIKLPQELINSSLIVKDVLGKTILDKKNLSLEDYIDISIYSKGIYFLSFNNEVINITKKVVVR